MEKLDEPEKDDLSKSELLNNIKIEDTNPVKDFYGFVVDLLKTGVIVFIIAVLLRYFIIQPYIVEGESMMPNYFNHEYLLAEKVSYMIGKPARGDVVVFKYPKNPSVSYIKRIIGLPGETVQIVNNAVTITNSQYPNGFVLNETYIPKNSKTLTNNSEPIKQTLKDNDYFVLGDNREHSSDSREWGILPYSDISGRSWLTLYPFGRIGVHHRVTFSTSGTADILRVLYAKIGNL